MDKDLQRAIEESKKQAELDRKMRQMQIGNQNDILLKRALSTSRREQEAYEAEMERQRIQKSPPANPPPPRVLSEEEQLKLAIEQSERDAAMLRENSQKDEDALLRAIEASKKTARDESDRRTQEEKEFNFVLQLSAALYQASKVSQQLNKESKVVVGEVMKEYAVPVVDGCLEVGLIQAKNMPDMKKGMYRMDPYIVMRVMCIAPVGNLKITIHRGTSLRNTQLLGVQDPYAVVFLDKRKRATTKIHYDSGKTPVWDETFDINMSGKEKNSSIEIQIWNKNALHDQRIGYAYLDIAEILSPTKNKWLRVHRKKKGSGSRTGRICVSWTFQPKGAPDFKTLKVLKSKACDQGGSSPEWNQLLRVPSITSDCYIQCTVRDERFMAKDTILAVSNVISVQGSIHQSFFSENPSGPTWYPLQPSKASRSKCPNGEAGRIQLKIKFTTDEMPNGIEPIEVDPTEIDSQGPIIPSGGILEHEAVVVAQDVKIVSGSHSGGPVVVGRVI